MKEARGRISQRAIKYEPATSRGNLIPASGGQQLPYLIKKVQTVSAVWYCLSLTALSR